MLETQRDSALDASPANRYLGRQIQIMKESMGGRLNDRRDGAVGLTIHPDYGLCLAHNENTSVLRTGFTLWQSWALQYDVAAQDSCWHPTHDAGVSCALILAWYAGPALIIDCNIEKCTSLNAARNQLGAIWAKTIVESWLVGLIVRAGFLTSECTDVHHDPIAIGGYPIILMSSEKGKTTVDSALAIDPTPTSLITAKTSLGKGFIANAISDSNLLGALFKLGSLRQYDRNLCIDGAERHKRAGLATSLYHSSSVLSPRYQNTCSNRFSYPSGFTPSMKSIPSMHSGSTCGPFDARAFSATGNFFCMSSPE